MSDTPLVDRCRKLWPLHRTLVSDGMDQALALVGEMLPPEAGYHVDRYVPKAPAWTWRVPERWRVEEATLAWEDGTPICSFADHPLHLVSYSISFEGDHVPWEKLQAHLHVGPERFPDALPWEFRYYERNWGFCLTFNQFRKVVEQVPLQGRTPLFRVRVRTRFDTGVGDGLAVGVARLEELSRRPNLREVVVCADLCHPFQVNDSITGAVAAIELAHRLVARPLPPRSRAVRFLFVPEVIGSICWLAHNERQIPLIDAAVFCEMLGTPGPFVVQESRGGAKDRLTRMANEVFSKHLDCIVQFRDTRAAHNDEIVFNGPGVDIPTVSFSRFPYPEYHTSADAPDILNEAQLLASVDKLEALVRLAATDWTPSRTFRGPLFLSGQGMWVDWRTNRELNAALEHLFLCLEGDLSIFDISQKIGRPFAEVYDYIERLREKRLVVEAVG